MKVIFLDVDGVLNDCATEERMESGYVGVDEPKVKILADIVECTGAKIVLTSSWKEGWSPVYGLCDDDCKYLLSKLKKYGLLVMDSTDDTEYDRGRGILNWLCAHPEVTGFVILDDHTFDFGECGLMGNFVPTTYWFGLTESCAAAAIETLNRKSKEE